MKYILIWWLASYSYGPNLATGTAVFDDAVACDAARSAIVSFDVTATHGAAGHPVAFIWANCFPAAAQ